MGTLAEMWRLASTPPAPMIFGFMVLVLVWSLVFRRQDRDAWVMCSALIAIWLFELFARTVLHDDSFRALLSFTDLVAAGAAIWLGNRSHREWLLVVYTTCVYSIALHVLWLVSAPFREVIGHHNYVASLNVLLVIRLLAISIPGAVYVGKAVGDILSHRRLMPAFARSGD